MSTPKKLLSFCVFADLHYTQACYPATVFDLKQILERAHRENADFVMHGGDFAGRFLFSPEIIKLYLQNEYGLSVYGVYGNHELQGRGTGTSMQLVTPTLTNDKNVVWGTPDTKIGDGSIGYYYFDKNGVRVIATDTNYSFNPELERWEHNPAESHCAPRGNLYQNSLGPKQLEWLESTLTDAAQKQLHCIIVSHAGFCGIEGFYRTARSPDNVRVREIFNKANTLRKNTVIMAINGHYHSNHVGIDEGILYLDVNTVRNGWWQSKKVAHYTSEHTYEFTAVDTNGEPIVTYTSSYDKLSSSQNTWYFKDPLSAVVTVFDDMSIKIDGSQTEWVYGISPGEHDGYEPKITSGTYKL